MHILIGIILAVLYALLFIVGGWEAVLGNIIAVAIIAIVMLWRAR